VTQPPSAAQSATTPKIRILLLPRPNGIQAQPMGEGKSERARDADGMVREGLSKSLMWFTGTDVLKNEPLRGILSCETNGRLGQWRATQNKITNSYVIEISI
jgi:hypothetical protein